MSKQLFLVLAMISVAIHAHAQQLHCGQATARQRLLKTHPEILKTEQDFNEQVRKGMKNIDLGKTARTTSIDESGNKNFWYDIPVVVHVIHDYGSEYVPDNSILSDLASWNVYYAKQNADTSEVYTHCPNFVPYIGNPHIRLHLATIDPNGNHTKGITRRRSYLTYTGDEQAKYDDWPSDKYVNIWLVNNMSRVHHFDDAYTHLPTDVASIPYYDGTLCLYEYAGSYKTINHELGHFFNLYHTWGLSDSAAVACGDDEVDDTPPTKGHLFSGCTYSLPSSNSNSIYDTACAENYYKIYLDIHGNDSLVNYPDTANTQNIMDFTFCDRMFTKGQVERMHASLNSSIANRNNLWSISNLRSTGIINTDDSFMVAPDMLPIAEFSVGNTQGTVITRFPVQYFTCPPSGSHPLGLTFRNESWNDTITSVEWNFSNEAAIPSSAAYSLTNKFSEPGWVSIGLAATGNNTGTTLISSQAVFVADSLGIPADGYYEEFSGVTAAKWPTFNYYNNEFKWQPSSAGVYDNNSMEYVGYDNRIVPATNTYPTTGMPAGDFDDMFSIPMDLSGFTGDCSLNYMYSGATRSSNPLDWNDTLEIDYSTDRSDSWVNLAMLGTRDIDNKGAFGVPYTPFSPGDWAYRGINIPVAARTDYTIFRFRYRPGIGVGPDSTTVTGSYSSGNNFYIDRINFSPWPASVSNVQPGNADVAVVPNPTNGDAYVALKGANNTTAYIVVTDITGRVVYTISEVVNSNDARILIPQTAIAVKGLYIVRIATGNTVATQKLVVE